jgi:hypothetical protein
MAQMANLVLYIFCNNKKREQRHNIKDKQIEGLNVTCSQEAGMGGEEK